MIRRAHDRFIVRCLRMLVFAERNRPSRDTLMILERIEQMSARSDAILAKITKNTDALKSLSMAIDALNEGHATIEERIKELKDQIAAGNEADFVPLETAADEQASVIEGAAKATTTGTEFESSNQ